MKNVINLGSLVIFKTQSVARKWQITLLKSQKLFVGKAGVLIVCSKDFMNDYYSFFACRKRQVDAFKRIVKFY
jgi:hypothetical protein